MNERTDNQQNTISQEDDDIRWLMSSPKGRRFIASQLHKAMVEEAVFNGNSRDIFLSGRRSIGCELLHAVKRVAFNDYMTMLREQHENG